MLLYPTAMLRHSNSQVITTFNLSLVAFCQKLWMVQKCGVDTRVPRVPHIGNKPKS